PVRRRDGDGFGKHSGAWKTVERTEERKTVAKLLQFFQTAARPSAIAARARHRLHRQTTPSGVHLARSRSRFTSLVLSLLHPVTAPCRSALSSANSEIKSGRNENRGIGGALANGRERERRRKNARDFIPQVREADSKRAAPCRFGRIVGNFEHRIMPECSRSGATDELMLGCCCCIGNLAGLHRPSTILHHERRRRRQRVGADGSQQGFVF
ncbi:hypothetical protein X777_09580, partial [Ooceraea biroi]